MNEKEVATKSKVAAKKAVSITNQGANKR